MEAIILELDQAHLSKQHFLSFLNAACDSSREEFWVADLVERKWKDELEHVQVFFKEWYSGDVDEIAWDVNRFTDEYIEKGTVLGTLNLLKKTN